MAFVNPLHPIYNASPLSFSDLVLATKSANGGGRDSRWVLPSLFVKTSKWESAFARDIPLANPVSFRCTDSQTEGVPLWWFSARGSGVPGTCMDATSDAVFTSVKTDVVHVKFVWPGYEEVFSKTVDLRPSGTPITRLDLGSQLAEFLGRVFNKLRLSPFSPVHGEHWQVGLQGLHFDQVLLLRVVNVFGDTWQAQLAIDPDMRGPL